jgi:imidazolonepropionase
MSRLRIRHIGWTASPAADLKDPYTLLHPSADTVHIEDGKILWIGMTPEEPDFPDAEDLDADGRGLTPGLIDFHAHPVFAATREAEFDMRTRGVSYAEIAAAGGGILNSAKRVNAASVEELTNFSRPFLDSALAHGTTTLEAKSGYGLSTEGELKLLRAIRELDRTHPIDLIPTFLGAHEYPPGYRENHEGYLKLLIDEMIPAVVQEKLAVAADAFCETGVFSLEETRRVLGAAKAHGLAVKVHADQLTPLGGAKLAAELGALSADHIEFIDDEGINALAGSGTVAGLLPVAAHFLRMKEDPPVRTMIERGIVCALATDFNPGSAMSENMQLALHLAAIRFRVTAEEAIWMATAGSAKALGLSDRGVLEPGYRADLVLWDAPSPEMLVYHFGVNQAAVVLKNGIVVARNGKRIP